MTGTDLCVNKPHCAAAVRPSESEATTSTLPPARVRTCSVLSGSCQSDERTEGTAERGTTHFSLEKTSRPLKFTTDSNNSMGKSVSHRPMCLSCVSASERAESAWRMNRMIVGREHPSPSQTLIVQTRLFLRIGASLSRNLEQCCPSVLVVQKTS